MPLGREVARAHYQYVPRNGVSKDWSGEVEATEILLAELAALLPALKKKKVIIPDEIRLLAKGVIVEKLLSMQVREAKEQAREQVSAAMMGNTRGMGNTNARGCGAAMMGNTNAHGCGAAMMGNQNSAKYNGDDEHVRILIRGALRFETQWNKIRDEYFINWFEKDAKAKRRGNDVLRRRWGALNEKGDRRIGEEKAKAKSKSGDLREHFGK